jgi:histidinol-phosphate aminotransferase
MPRSEDMNGTSSRRKFLKYASMAAAAAPIMTEAHFAQAATRAVAAGGGRSAADAFFGTTTFPEDAVLINANENPMGPAKVAIEAINLMAPNGGRYDFYNQSAKLIKTFAAQNGLKPENIMVYAGSSDPLQYTVMAYTGPNKPLVIADPTYEAAGYAAQSSGAPIFKVKLAADYSHDMRAMVAASPNAGVIYVCNPNNPTGTITAKKDLMWGLENKPKGSVLLVDEAYIHLSDGENMLDQVAAGKDIVVLRTFSKVYGMAGIRCGFVIGRPDLIKKLMKYGMNPMVVTGSAAAEASLNDPELVPTRKKIIADIRLDTISWLKSNGYKVIGDSQSNCFMIDCGRPGKEVIRAMVDKNVYIGRTWPVWPNAVRITVGSKEDMARFKTAWKQVMDAPAAPVNAENVMPGTMDGVKLA